MDDTILIEVARLYRAVEARVRRDQRGELYPQPKETKVNTAVHFNVWNDDEWIEEDLQTGETRVTRAGWYVWLFDRDGCGTCYHKEPFKTEAEARSAVAVTGLTEDTGDQA